MPTTSITRNENPAARTNRDGLRFVLQTTPRPQQKDAINDLIYDGDAQVQFR
jgi:hypothetical protein